MLGTLIDAVTNLKDSITDLTSVNKDTLKEEQGDSKQSAFAKFKDVFSKQKERYAARRKEVDEEKEGSKIKGKSKGPLGGVISAIMGLGGMLLKGMSFLPGLLIKGMMLSLTTLVPSLATTISKIAASGIGALAKGAVGTVARVAGGLALKGLGATAAAVFSPVGLAIIGTAAALYGGYKLYKYLTKNSLGSGISGKMTRLRILSYGYNDTNKDHYNKVMDLDMLMQDYVSAKDGKAVYKEFDKKFKDKVIEIFQVSRSEAEKYKLLNDWFTKRYVIGHAAFMHAYYGAGGTNYLDDLDKLTN